MTEEVLKYKLALMLMTWQRFLLVFWFVLLQGVSPLLHAHVLGQVAQRGVHMHVLENERATAVPFWHEAKAHDGTEIGVAQAGRHDQPALLPDLPHAAVPHVPSGQLVAGACFLPGSLRVRPPPADADRLTPPSQAPPFRSA